jgi:hypothetical protein
LSGSRLPNWAGGLRPRSWRGSVANFLRDRACASPARRSWSSGNPVVACRREEARQKRFPCRNGLGAEDAFHRERLSVDRGRTKCIRSVMTRKGFCGFLPLLIVTIYRRRSGKGMGYRLSGWFSVCAHFQQSQPRHENGGQSRLGRLRPLFGGRQRRPRALKIAAGSANSARLSFRSYIDYRDRRFDVSHS